METREKKISVTKVIIIAATVAVTLAAALFLLYKLLKKYFKVSVECGDCDSCDDCFCDDLDCCFDDEDYVPECSIADDDEEVEEKEDK